MKGGRTLGQKIPLTDNLKPLTRTSKYLAFVATALFFCACSGVGYRLGDHQHFSPRYYQVKRGDTLAKVALDHNVSLESLLWLNGLKGDSLNTGDLLLISFDGHSPHSSGSSWGDQHHHDSEGIHHSHKRPKTGSIPSNNTGANNFASVSKFAGESLSWPIRTGKLVSGFGKRGRSFHDGIDIAAPTGTPIYAAHRGVVVYSASGLRGYGRLVIVRSPNGLLSVYAHNSRLLVRKGQRVSRGEKIALVGSTGRSSGPHLHFEVRAKDSVGRYMAVDPLPILKGSATRPNSRRNESLTPLL